MDQNQWGVLLIGLGIGVVLILILNQNGSAGVVPSHVYDNEETWEIQRDSRGKAVKLTVHRDARLS